MGQSFKVKIYSMTKRLRQYIGLGVLFLTSMACEEQEIHKFLDVSRIQFGNVATIGDTNDSSFEDWEQNFTFVYSPSSQIVDTAYFNIFASGGPVAYDRYFTLRQVNLDEVENAVAGIHYLAFNTETTNELQCIRAGEVSAQCGIVLLRDSSLQTTEVTLAFVLEQSDDFELGDPDYLYRKLEFTDQLTKPNTWTDYLTGSFLGKYSKTKHRFMIDVTGQPWNDEFIIQAMRSYAEFTYWVNRVKKALAEYNNANPDNPLRDENGDLIEFK